MARTRDPDAVRPPDLSLTRLRAAGEAEWRSGEYDGLDFSGLDLPDWTAGSTRFVECRIRDSRFGELKLRRSRVTVGELVDVTATTLDVAEGEWTDVAVRGGRLGALLAPGATWARVALRGIRSNYVNLRGATIVDLTIEDSKIEELDLGLASIQRAVIAADVDRLVLTGASCTAVDLRRAELGEIEGVAELRGTTITAYQLTRLAPALAAQLGVRVVE